MRREEKGEGRRWERVKGERGEGEGKGGEGGGEWCTVDGACCKITSHPYM